MFQWRIQIPVRIKQDPECSVVLNKIISAGTLCPFSTKIMSPTLSSELAIDTCPLLVNLQYLDEFQGNLLRGIDKCSGVARSVVQRPKKGLGRRFACI